MNVQAPRRSSRALLLQPAASQLQVLQQQSYFAARSAAASAVPPTQQLSETLPEILQKGAAEFFFVSDEARADNVLPIAASAVAPAAHVAAQFEACMADDDSPPPPFTVDDFLAARTARQVFGAMKPGCLLMSWALICSCHPEVGPCCRCNTPLCAGTAPRASVRHACVCKAGRQASLPMCAQLCRLQLRLLLLSKLARPERGITMMLTATPDRLHMLDDLCSSYPGPLSVALYVSIRADGPQAAGSFAVATEAATAVFER